MVDGKIHKNANEVNEDMQELQNKIYELEVRLNEDSRSTKNQIETRFGELEVHLSNLVKSSSTKLESEDFDRFKDSMKLLYLTKADSLKIWHNFDHYLKESEFVRQVNESENYKLQIKNEIKHINDLIQSDVRNEILRTSKEFENKIKTQNNFNDKTKTKVGNLANKLSELQHGLRDHTDALKAVKKELRKKDNISEVDKIRAKLKDAGVVKAADLLLLKKIREETLPQVEDIEQSIRGMNCQIYNHKTILARFDEILCSKASKISFEEILKQGKQNQTDLKQLFEFKEDSLDSRKKLQTEIEHLNVTLEEFEKQMRVIISSFLRKEVNKVQTDLKNSIFQGNITRDQVRELVDKKVDKIEFIADMEQKSNKNDLYMHMQSIDIIHKQMKSIIALFVEMNTQRCNSMTQKELSEKVLLKQKSNLLDYSKQVLKWINLFDPQNINNEALLLPQYVKFNKLMAKTARNSGRTSPALLFLTRHLDRGC